MHLQTKIREDFKDYFIKPYNSRKQKNNKIEKNNNKKKKSRSAGSNFESKKKTTTQTIQLPTRPISVFSNRKVIYRRVRFGDYEH